MEISPESGLPTPRPTPTTPGTVGTGLSPFGQVSPVPMARLDSVSGATTTAEAEGCPTPASQRSERSERRRRRRAEREAARSTGDGAKSSGSVLFPPSGGRRRTTGRSGVSGVSGADSNIDSSSSFSSTSDLSSSSSDSAYEESDAEAGAAPAQGGAGAAEQDESPFVAAMSRASVVRPPQPARRHSSLLGATSGAAGKPDEVLKQAIRPDGSIDVGSAVKAWTEISAAEPPLPQPPGVRSPTHLGRIVSDGPRSYNAGGPTSPLFMCAKAHEW